MNAHPVECPELRLERREYKYLLPVAMVPRVRAAAKTVCELDGNAGENGRYAIRSLYFDTFRYDLYRATCEERGDRFKVRARTYPKSLGAAESDSVFLEVKQRQLEVIVKTRGKVPADRWAELVQSPRRQGLSFLEVLPAVERFQALVQTYHLAPTMLVQYDREAYKSLVDDYARLTFDLNILCQPKAGLDLEADPKMWHSIDHVAQTRTSEPVTVLELKFQGSVPRWMASMVTRLELQRFAFSKYGYGIAQHLALPSARQALPRRSGRF